MNKKFICSVAERQIFLTKITEMYPEISTGRLARSILGRDINYFRLGEGRRSIVLVGAHHGMEYITSAVLYDFIEDFLEKSARGDTCYGINTKILTQLFTLWVVPCLNPDGVFLATEGISKNPLYDRELRMNGGSLDFSDWQANARGVDLNHNYDAGFYEYKKIEAEEGIAAGKTRFSGEHPESEPEVRGMANFVRVLMPDAVVSLHTQGGEIFSSPKDAYTSRIAARCAEAVGYTSTYPTEHSAYGGLCDYTGGVLGIPSFTVELGRGKNPLPHSAYGVLCDSFKKIFFTLIKTL